MINDIRELVLQPINGKSIGYGYSLSVHDDEEWLVTPSGSEAPAWWSLQTLEDADGNGIPDYVIEKLENL